MRYWLVLILLPIILTLSCNNFDKAVAFEELREAEYTRSLDDIKLITWLNHKNADIRLRAVKTLASLQDTSKAILLANRLTDEDPRVRAAAAFGLGQLFSTTAENYILDGLRNESNKEIRIKLIEALGKSGSNKNVFPLRDFIESSDQEYQKAAAVACGMLAYRRFPPRSLTPYLGERMMNAEGPEVVWRYAYALYRMSMLGSFDNFKDALSFEDPLVEYFTLKGLNSLVFLINSPQFQGFRNKQGYQELMRTYRSRNFRNQLLEEIQDSTWYVRVAGMELLGNMGEESLQNDIIKFLDDPHPHVRLEAIRALENYPNWLTRREMRRVYREETDWRLRGEALSVLALVQPEEAMAHIQNDLLNQSWPQNYYALKTLQNIKSSDVPVISRRMTEARIDQATTLLMQLADGDNIAQTTLALEILVNRTKPPEIDFFLEKLKTGDRAVATVTATYFSILSNPRPVKAVKPLIEVYQQFTAPRDLEAMEPIITALDSIGSPEAVPFLEEQLNHPYPTIREKAKHALLHITDRENIQIPEVEEAYSIKWDFPAVSPDSIYRVTFATSVGEFTIELFPEKAPVNVANFVQLVKQGFYEGINFHRVVPGFVVQAGDPRGDGWGGPGYTVPCEYNDIFYDRGVVGVAHAGKDTGGSQFFITHTPQPHLNGKHTAFGQVISGMEVVDQLMIFDKIERTELSILSKDEVGATKEPVISAR